MLRVGTLGYATEQGLGRLVKSFYDAGIVTDVGVIPHSSHPNQFEWYPRDIPIYSKSEAFDFCKGMDVMLFFETPFFWELIPYCRQHGIPTILMPMYECTPDPIPEMPDYFICPSLLDLVEFPKSISRHIPVPVQVPFRLRTQANVFVHNAGHGGLMGRNGTAEFLKAIPLVKSDVAFIVRAQSGEMIRLIQRSGVENDERVMVTYGTVPFEELWGLGDVFVFPEKFNGLSLPLQEAYAAGMLVMATDRFPNDTWLPEGPLIPTCGFTDAKVHRRMRKVKQAAINPADIAATIDHWAGRDIRSYSDNGRYEAQFTYSWACLRCRYESFIEKVYRGENPLHC